MLRHEIDMDMSIYYYIASLLQIYKSLNPNIS